MYANALPQAKRPDPCSLSASHFLAAASHELRQPLQTVGLLQWLLLTKVEEKNEDKEILKLVTRLDESLTSLSSLLNTVLDMSQLEAGLVRPKKVNFPINILLNQLKAEFTESLASKGIYFHVVPSAYHIQSDPRLLGEMIHALLSKALKYTEKGKILLGCRRHGDTVLIEVGTTGCNLSEGGIEYSLVERLGFLLGHEITTPLSLDSGSILSIKVPLGYEQTTIKRLTQANRAQEPHDAQVQKVYVVDDDSALGDALRDVLQKNNLWVQTYTSGEMFLENSSAEDQGCLLVDACMTGMSGLELLQQLKDQGRPMPSIMITGNGDIQTAVRAMKIGVLDFIEKPVRPDELLQCITRAMNEGRSTTKKQTETKEAQERVSHLTQRERQIMDRVLAGHPNKIIASDLGISQRTVENHRAAVMKKTGSKSLPALLRLSLAAA